MTQVSHPLRGLVKKAFGIAETCQNPCWLKLLAPRKERDPSRAGRPKFKAPTETLPPELGGKWGKPGVPFKVLTRTQLTGPLGMRHFSKK